MVPVDDISPFLALENVLESHSVPCPLCNIALRCNLVCHLPWECRFGLSMSGRRYASAVHQRTSLLTVAWNALLYPWGFLLDSDFLYRILTSHCHASASVKFTGRLRFTTMLCHIRLRLQRGVICLPVTLLSRLKQRWVLFCLHGNGDLQNLGSARFRIGWDIVGHRWTTTLHP